MTFFWFMVGACWGSFLLASAGRYVTHASLLYPASHCDTCQTPLRVGQLIPVLSYLYQRGQCLTCGAPIPLWTWLIEILAGLLLASGHSGLALRIVVIFYLWLFAATCDALVHRFPSWIGPLTMALLCDHLTSPTIGLLIVGYAGLHWLWPRWRRPWIGDGDLEAIGLMLVFLGPHYTSQWLLTACLSAWIFSRQQPRLAFIPHLYGSALGWWFYRLWF